VDLKTRGGWFVAKPSLKSALVAAGLPESPPVSPPDGRSISSREIGLLAALGAFVGVLIMLARRRSQSAHAA
jgi:hypothetical protein